MAASSSGYPPLSWGDDPNNEIVQERVDGSHTGATLPPYIDPEGLYGELHLLRILGINGPLPNRPFHIRRSVEKFVGGKIDGAFPESNKSTYALKVRNLHQFNRLLMMNQLMDGTAVQVIEHPTLNSIRCVVSCRDVIDMPDTELLEELKEQGVKEIRRITRKNGQQRENTPAIVLTCRGTSRPETIEFGYIRCRTRPYYPSPMQCFNCWLFGHTKLRCQSKAATCGTCSGDHPIPENRECNHEKFCKSCNTNDHSISSRSCPLWQFENSVQRVKVDQGISYPAARRLVNQNRGGKSFANVVDTTNNEALRQTNERIDHLTATVAAKDAEIAELRAALLARPTPPVVINPEIEALKAIVANQAKQIELLTSQISVFLKAVMPAANISIPSTIASSPTTSKSVVATAPVAVEEATSKSADHSDPPSANAYPDSEANVSDVSPNAVEFLTPSGKNPISPNTPKPPKPVVSGASRISSDPLITPNKRSLSNLTRSGSGLQQQKKAKHKSAPEGQKGYPKR